MDSSKIGDLREEDFSTLILRIIRYLEIIKNTVSNIRQKKKKSLQKNRGLNKNVRYLNMLQLN
jgi:hypothetical protein